MLKFNAPTIRKHILIATLLAVTSHRGTAATEADVLVYGSTPGGSTSGTRVW